ncbi:hypothetical protein ANN_09632 [Periplaneta americana]|uniref:Uncharacterized protein n=1 Tax=Periplaneta americana TaxID=6978 RepID=A0ABQ8TLX0_PERAM|nr:hypothetical protein ANN_09632 [Periplaneta americana]
MTTDMLRVRVACWGWMSYDGAGLLERIHEQPPVRTPEEFWDRVLDAREKMTKNLDLFHNLVDSMPHIMRADVDAGEHVDGTVKVNQSFGLLRMERTRDNSKEAESFREQFNTRSAEYVKEILSPHFGGILQFVKEGEVLVDKGQADELKNHKKKALALVQSFPAGWKLSLEELNREILSSFPNLVTGSSLLQLALTQLVQYYHRFQKLLTPNARAQLTNIHHNKVKIYYGLL